MFNEERRLQRPIRWGMVGGGRGSQIGYSHRDAAVRDGLFRFLAGAFYDGDRDRCREFGRNIGLDGERCYGDYRALFAGEAARRDGIEAVSIATPNATHHEICKAALQAGLHVICEKPVTFTTAQAEELKALAEEVNRVIAVMYGYSGYPMVHQAREMVARGDLGTIRVVNMQFAHGFHSEERERHDPGLKWRVDPQVSGPTYVIGDLGTHPFHLCAMMTGLGVKRLACIRQSFIASRAPLEDNAHIMMEFAGGAVGTLWVSAINAGALHEQKIRIVGEKASLQWWDERPNQLRYEVQGKPLQILERDMDYLYKAVDGVAASHIPGGHPEGYFESWANLYHRFALVFDAVNRGDKESAAGIWYPDIDAGIAGVRLCEKCVESADNHGAWVDFH